jgi:glutamate racemase
MSGVANEQDRANAPIGVFDSGLGGLTVVRSLLESVPNERIVYLGDTARVPYGTRSAETVVRYARGCARLLTERGVKAIVVACNTVSAVALDMLRAELDLPVIGVVDPGASAAVRAAEAVTAASASTKQHAEPPKIGVLGTSGTIRSGAYPRAVARLTTRLEVVGLAAPLLVPLVEEGWTEGQVPALAVRRYVAPLIEAGAGVVVLGCTHYPLLGPLIAEAAAELAGRPVPVVDSAHATAEVVAEWLAQGRIPRSTRTARPNLELLVTDLPEGFANVARRFLGGHDVPEVHQVDI